MEPWVYFLIIGVLFFLMMRGGCGAHVMGHGHHRHNDGDARQSALPGSVPTTGPAKVRDPVCGKTIDADAAKTSVHRGTIRYFCSDECRSKFEAEPEKYVATTA
jgi:YHS domain-containing protein